MARRVQHRVVRMRDQCAHIRSRRVPEIHQNIRVNVRNLCITDAIPFQAALINQTPGTNPLTFLKD